MLAAWQFMPRLPRDEAYEAAYLEDVPVEDMRLLVCRPLQLSELTDEEWMDELGGEDGEGSAPHAELLDLIAEFNEKLTKIEGLYEATEEAVDLTPHLARWARFLSDGRLGGL